MFVSGLPVAALSRLRTSAFTPLPTVASATLVAAFSPWRLTSGHAGPTLTVCATAAADTPASTLDVAVDATGTPDFSAAVAAYGASFDVYRWYDQSGAGNHAVSPTAAMRQKIIVANKWGSLQPVTATIVGSVLTQGAIIPDTLVTSRQSVSIVSVTAQRGMQTANTVFGLANTGSTTTYLNLVSDNGRVQALGNAFIKGGRHGLVRPCVKAICCGASSTKIHRNDDVTSAAALTASASMAGGAIGGIKTGATTLAATYHSTAEDHFAHLVYSAQVSDADMVTLKAALYAKFGISTSATGQLMLYGDSIMWGQQSTSGIGFPSRILPYLTARDVYVSNPSTPGKTMATGYSEYAGNIAPGYDASKAKRILYCTMGTNDLGAGTTAATLETTATNLVAAAKATGWDVAMGSILPRNDASWNSTKETERGTYNAWLLSSATQASLGYTAIDRTAGGTIMTDPNSASYYTDHLHPVDAGYQALADHEGPILAALLA